MNISTILGEKNSVVGYAEDIPVIPLGFDININGKFKNASEEVITIEDPLVSQNVTVLCWLNGKFITEFFLTPSIADPGGAIIGPMPESVELKKGESRTVSVSLYERNLGSFLRVGNFKVSFAYDTIEAPPCEFIISFKKRSVLKLLSMLQDEFINVWARGESLKWLQKVNPEFEYDFEASDQTENRKRVEEFKCWWEENRDSLEMDALFAKLSNLEGFESKK
ncbi:hypothetical protein QA601_03010 [Chitinispirillales bacterium ANBcel5]|uniref:hypothetical protein n=1 Tax=Cellulosispirillum alkaliphilum TaxID=3039283 RepID=UPI002A53CD21|nr:hypothetical protein [Chitinispirillales bacterium ANBcel5]